MAQQSMSDLRWQAQDNVRIFSAPFAIQTTTIGARCERLRQRQMPIGQRAVSMGQPYEVWYPEGNWMEDDNERDCG
jgi:hypothetical protein